MPIVSHCQWVKFTMFLVPKDKVFNTKVPGIAANPNLPPRPAAGDSLEPPTGPLKWHVCQHYGELNKVTRVPLMLQGNIHTKQQKVCGQWWCSVFDFAAGFYAVEIHEDRKPYLALYDECKGFPTYAQILLDWREHWHASTTWQHVNWVT